MQPLFVTKPAFTVVGLNIHVAAKSPKIAALWQAFGPRMREVQHLAEPGVCLGLMDHFDMMQRCQFTFQSKRWLNVWLVNKIQSLKNFCECRTDFGQNEQNLTECRGRLSFFILFHSVNSV